MKENDPLSGERIILNEPKNDLLLGARTTQNMHPPGVRIILNDPKNCRLFGVKIIPNDPKNCRLLGVRIIQDIGKTTIIRE